MCIQNFLHVLKMRYIVSGRQIIEQLSIEVNTFPLNLASTLVAVHVHTNTSTNSIIWYSDQKQPNGLEFSRGKDDSDKKYCSPLRVWKMLLTNIYL